MKEAAGEANMTVVTIVLISIVLTIGTLIVSTLMRNTGRKSQCGNCGGFWEDGVCHVTEGSSATITNYETCN